MAKRFVFHVDVGDMSSEAAVKYVGRLAKKAGKSGFFKKGEKGLWLAGRNGIPIVMEIVYD